MMALCRCRRFKTIAPFHSAATKRWMCEGCKRKSINAKRERILARVRKQARLRAVMMTVSVHVAKR